MRLPHSWVRGVKVTPLLHNVAQVLFQSIIEEMGEKITEHISHLKRCFTEENGRFMDLFELNSQYEKTVFMPKAWMPQSVEEREALSKQLSKTLSDGYKGTITIKLYGVKQCLDVKWTTQLPPTTERAKLHAKNINFLIKQVMQQCKDCYYSG